MKKLNAVVSFSLAVSIIFSCNTSFAVSVKTYEEDEKTIKSFEEKFEGYEEYDFTSGDKLNDTAMSNLNVDGLSWELRTIDNCRKKSLVMSVPPISEKKEISYKHTAWKDWKDNSGANSYTKPEKSHFAVSVYPFSTDIIFQLNFLRNDQKKVSNNNSENTIKLVGFSNEGTIEFLDSNNTKWGYSKAFEYSQNQWYNFDIYVDSVTSAYTLFINGICYAEDMPVYIKSGTSGSDTENYYDTATAFFDTVTESNGGYCDRPVYTLCGQGTNTEKTHSVAIDNFYIERYENIPSPTLKAVKALSGGLEITSLDNINSGETIKFVCNNIPNEHIFIVAVYKYGLLDTAIIPENNISVVRWSVPADKTGYSVKAMLWKNFDSINPLIEEVFVN